MGAGPADHEAGQHPVDDLGATTQEAVLSRLSLHGLAGASDHRFSHLAEYRGDEQPEAHRGGHRVARQTDHGHTVERGQSLRAAWLLGDVAEPGWGSCLSSSSTLQHLTHHLEASMADPAAGHHRVRTRLPDRLGQHRPEPRRVIAGSHRPGDLDAMPGAQGLQHRPVGVADHRRTVCAITADLITTGADQHPGDPTHRQLGDPLRGDRPHRPGIHHMTSRQQLCTGAQVRACESDEASGFPGRNAHTTGTSSRASTSGGRSLRSLEVGRIARLHRHHRRGPGRQPRPGHHRDHRVTDPGGGVGDRVEQDVARVGPGSHRRPHREASAGQVRFSQGVAVHLGVVEAWGVLDGHHAAGQTPPDCRRGRDVHHLALPRRPSLQVRDQRAHGGEVLLRAPGALACVTVPCRACHVH